MRPRAIEKKKYPRLLAASLMAPGLFFCSSVCRAEHTRVTNPNAVSVEAFGRAFMGAIQFDRVVTDDLAAGIGIGRVSTQTLAGADTGVTATLIPVYANYYFAREAGSLFVTTGATLIGNSGDVKGLKPNMSGFEFGSSAVYATAGGGYEVRTDSGILFRATGYAILAEKIAPWVGLTLGYSF
jgi:hypothetical protein